MAIIRKVSRRVPKLLHSALGVLFWYLLVHSPNFYTLPTGSLSFSFGLEYLYSLSLANHNGFHNEREKRGLTIRRSRNGRRECFRDDSNGSEECYFENERIQARVVRELVNTHIEHRKEQEERDERKCQDGRDEKKRRDDERKCMEEMEFDVQKLRLENERIRMNETTNSELVVKSKVELQNFLPKFDPKNNDISLYLVLFEKQAKRVEIKRENLTSHLIGLLPYNVALIIIIVYETSGKKKTSLGVISHTNCFHEWIRGLQINTFEDLCDLMITDQIKRTPPETASVNRRTRENFQRKYSAFIKRLSWEEQKNLPVWRYIPPHSRENTRSPKKEEIKTSTKECYICGLQHLAKKCPKKYKATGMNGYIDRYTQVDHSVTAEIQTEFLLESRNKKESSEPKLAMSDLQYAEFAVNGKSATALIDSGSMITVLNSELISDVKMRMEK
ncbi:uncharacterized protein NPIL_586341 [Nephila pilipes]|uniref:Uncharacterized protein n=1 Tax=Nephila pilipes TaxID=299642 RepID=A0A8X6M7J2_NEPPI|nr:uncharacterized protein NPIL_586341 [Nephila pilipes]